MHLAVIGFVVLVVLYLFSLTGCGQSTTRPSAKPPVTTNPPVTQKKPSAAADRDAIKKKLRALAAKPAPTKLAQGAMCYEVAMPPSKATYVCPTCNERSLYTAPKGEFLHVSQTIQYDLPHMRRQVKAIGGLKVELDESEFCKKCKPKTDSPVVVLVVTYGDEKHITRGVGPGDLRLLTEFMAGQDKHSGSTGNESPLKKHMKRLEQLLGVKLDD